MYGWFDLKPYFLGRLRPERFIRQSVSSFAWGHKQPIYFFRPQWAGAHIPNGQVPIFPMGRCPYSQWAGAHIPNGQVPIFPMGRCPYSQWAGAHIPNGQVPIFPMGRCPYSHQITLHFFNLTLNMTVYYLV